MCRFATFFAVPGKWALGSPCGAAQAALRPTTALPEPPERARYAREATLDSWTESNGFRARRGGELLLGASNSFVCARGPQGTTRAARTAFLPIPRKQGVDAARAIAQTKRGSAIPGALTRFFTSTEPLHLSSPVQPEGEAPKLRC